MDENNLYRQTFSQIHSSRIIAIEEYQVRAGGHSVSQRALLLAAAAVLLALTAMAFAVRMWRLQEIAAPYPSPSFPSEVLTAAWEETQPQAAPPRETYLTLQGYQDSPESLALSEWLAFQQSYDPDHEILNRIGNASTGLEERYSFYTPYTREMADELDRIAEKYGLKLHTEFYDILDRQELFDRVGGDFAGGANGLYSMYMYEDGTFHYDGDVTMPDGTVWEYQMNRCVKGSLTEAYLMLYGGVEDFDQWTYRTACGVPVLLAVSDAQALILAERKNSFVTVNVFADRESMAREELEAIADTFNWSIIG